MPSALHALSTAPIRHVRFASLSLEGKKKKGNFSLQKKNEKKRYGVWANAEPGARESSGLRKADRVGFWKQACLVRTTPRRRMLMYPNGAGKEELVDMQQ
ncbi:hypothetical protein EVAR_95651_1 [Eumeta japonica]|uniref:Uncharacterized protein n=1 Tax=Eumeta variegata TaxID=151549 RepID=A0A4C1VKH0_EUMVA|nr:hypothetical protein EVAR_95651_1 [Eumeta japonica]